MVGALVASQFNTAQNWALGSAMAVILIMMILASVAIFAIAGLVARGLIRRRPRRSRLGGGAGVSAATTAALRPKRDFTNGLLAVWGVLVFVFLFLPIVMIVIYSFNDGRALVVWNEFGLKAVHGRPEQPHDPQRDLHVDPGRRRRRRDRDDHRLAGGDRAGTPAGQVDDRLPRPRLPRARDARDRRRDRAPDLVREARRSRRRAVLARLLHQLRTDPALHRTRDLRVGGRHADRPRAARRPRRVARGGLGRPLRLAHADVPQDHAPVDDARRARRRTARIQPEPGQHDHLVVRLHGRRLTVAGVRVQLATERPPAVDRGDVYARAPVNAVRPRRSWRSCSAAAARPARRRPR